MAEALTFVWNSKYLDTRTLDEYMELTLQQKAELIKSSFSNFIKFGLNVAPKDDQQADFIFQIDDAIFTNEKTDISVRSGHGTGKTTIISWAILYVGLVFEDSKIPTTAPVASQLEKILIPEVKKWRNKLYPPLRSLIEVQSKDVKFSNGNECFARTARKDNTEALAGVHASFVLYVLDEASGIDQAIHDVIEGALTGDRYLLIMTSNPTRTVGTFYDSHNRNRSSYRTIHMDSEKSANVKKSWVEKMEKKYGRDSDTFRVRVKGLFPRANTDSLFSTDEVLSAMKHATKPDSSGAVVFSADVARFGDDTSVLAKRRGYSMYSIDSYAGLNTMEYANKISNEIEQEPRRPDAVFVDTIGVGAGVMDRLRERGYMSIDANASMKADKVNVYHNKRAEMYFNLKDWIGRGGQLPEDDELLEELVSIRYSYTDTGKILLTKKSEIKDELGRSPDKGDACALSFFADVRVHQSDVAAVVETDYDPFN